VHGKALTFRAGTNATPRWEHDTRTGPALESDAPLVLEGLAFSGQPVASGSGLARQNWRGRATEPQPLSGETWVRCGGAPLFIVHCQFRSPWEAIGGRPGFADLTVSNSPHMELRHSRFVTPWAKSVVLKHAAAGNQAAAPPARLILTNCMVTGEDNLWLEIGSGSRMELDLSRSIFRERAAIVLARAEEPRSVRVAARQNTFTTRYQLDDEREASGLELREVLQWEDALNLYSTTETLFVDSPGYPKALRGRRAFDYWKEFCNTSPEESVLGQFSLGIQAPQDGLPNPGSSFLFVNGLVILRNECGRPGTWAGGVRQLAQLPRLRRVARPRGARPRGTTLIPPRAAVAQASRLRVRFRTDEAPHLGLKFFQGISERFSLSAGTPHQAPASRSAFEVEPD
jgi:hypothetical protein